MSRQAVDQIPIPRTILFLIVLDIRGSDFFGGSSSDDCAGELPAVSGYVRFVPGSLNCIAAITLRIMSFMFPHLLFPVGSAVFAMMTSVDIYIYIYISVYMIYDILGGVVKIFFSGRGSTVLVGARSFRRTPLKQSVRRTPLALVTAPFLLSLSLYIYIKIYVYIYIYI